MNDQQPHVVIIGGGFGGLYAARRLARLPVRITLLDRRNHHLFQPLLYQVATGALSPANIAQPLRSILRRYRNVRVQLAEAVSVDTDKKVIQLTDGAMAFDYLVVAAGATDNYFAHAEWDDLAPGLKSLESATRMRSKFLLAFEMAAREPDVERRSHLLTFVIVGGGATGVELAGTMAEMARTTLAQDFPDMDAKQARVILLEGAPRVLPPFPPDLSASALRQLQGLGVEVRCNTMVTRLEPGLVYLGDERIAAGTVFWAAGVRGNELGRSLGAPTDKVGRVLVEPDLSLPGHGNVFVIGDLAAVTDGAGKKVPGVAPAAMQMGSYVAECVSQDLKNKPRVPFIYRDKGSLATIGRNAAVADLGRLHISGLLAWLAWLLIHVYFLIGLQNRLMVLMQWAWAYLSFQRPARLITYTHQAMQESREGMDHMSVNRSN